MKFMFACKGLIAHYTIDDSYIDQWAYMHLIKTKIQVSPGTALNHHHCIVTTTCAYCYPHHNYYTCQCPVWAHSSTTRYTMYSHKAALACIPWRGPGFRSTSPARSRSSRRKTQGLANIPQSCCDTARYLYLQKEMFQQLYITQTFLDMHSQHKC